MLKLQAVTVAAILRMASRYPDIEVCGLVWGSERLGQVTHPLPNVHSDPGKYYRTAPKDVREAFAIMDEEKGELIAWYHSHPGGKPDPSEEDMRGAFNVGLHYLIAYPWYADTEIRSWGSDVPVRTDRDSVWRISTWECIAVGVLVESEYEIIP